MQVKIKVCSKFGNSEEVVEIESLKDRYALVAKLKRLHAHDGATVTVSNFKKGYWEQVC